MKDLCVSFVVKNVMALSIPVTYGDSVIFL